MDADFSVELGPPSEEATLEFPWDSDRANGPRYLDLKREPELVQFLAEAAAYPEIGELLLTLNSKASLFETAKCDVWVSDDLEAAEDIYGAECKLGAYVDVVFGEEQAEARFSFFHHESLARALAELLRNSPDLPAAVELIVRRCYYRTTAASGGEEFAPPAAAPPPVQSGFYCTFYVFGYGHDEEQARLHWHAALRLLGNAVLQVSAQMRTH